MENDKTTEKCKMAILETVDCKIAILKTVKLIHDPPPLISKHSVRLVGTFVCQICVNFETFSYVTL